MEKIALIFFVCFFVGFIEGLYNRSGALNLTKWRRHSFLNYLSPSNFELSVQDTNNKKGAKSPFNK